MDFINKLAVKYRSNPVAKILFAPLWHLYMPYNLKKRNRFFRLYGMELLSKVKKVLDSEDCFFFLFFGTLLGAYREHAFLQHDLDIDCAAFVDIAERLPSILEKEGIKLLYEYRVEGNKNGIEQTYVYKSVTIDFFFYEAIGNDLMRCHSFASYGAKTVNNIEKVSVKQIVVPNKGFTKIYFNGEYFNIPAYTEEYLGMHYGVNFMFPNKHFDYKKEATNIKYFSIEEMIGYRRNYIS